MIGLRCLVAITLITAVRPLPGHGQDRLVRRISSAGEVMLGGVRSLAQDSVGFLWLGTNGGLMRWDGIELRRWATDQLDTWINYMTVCPDGTLFVVEEGGTLFRVTESGAEPVHGPGGRPFDRLRNSRCDADNRLWVAATTAVWHDDRAGTWHEASPGTFATEPPFIIEGPRQSGVLVRTARSLWQLAAGGAARRLLDAPIPQALAITAEGDTLLLTRSDGMFRLGRGGRTLVVGPIGRGIDLQRRGSTVWASFDRFLVAIRPGEPPEVIDSDVLPEGGGLMVIDREGSLWLATFSGLVQFPEPETVYWTDQHGFPSAHTRYLARTAGRVWASTWQGLGYIEERGGRRIAHALPDEWRTAMPLHVDPRGVLWLAAETGLLEVSGGRIIRTRLTTPIVWEIHDAPDGGVWLASDAGLMHAPANGTPIIPVRESPFATGDHVRQILRARDGRLWLAGDERVCGTTRPAATLAGAAWTCDSLPGAVEITDLIELPSGALWAASSRLGVWRQREGRWEPHPGSATMPSPALYRLRPARGDGVWVLGAPVLRVREDLQSRLGWEVLETVAGWQGVTSVGGDVLEDADGTMWVTTSVGIARVPPMARRAAPVPPPVVLVDVAVDGVTVGDTALQPLRHRHNRLDVRFAALSYRDAARIRYQVRLAPREDWSDHAGTPAFRWIDLPAGRYRAEVRASLDGREWSPHPASFSVTVRAPWYLQAWAYGLAALLVATVAYVAHRLRVRELLRLERQRTRIALDLHDEMGSALGSIGILSGVLAGEQVEPAERRRLTGKIAEIAAELGASLSDIIWSLRGRAGTLQDVAARLAEHGARLFAGNAARFEAELPNGSGRQTPLDFTVSRAVLLIGVEALYNAARHAGATRVMLAVVTTQNEWRVVVEDDGRGLPVAPAEGRRGLGRVSMQRRADEIGARLTWEPVEFGGTRVTLRMIMRGER
jgi:signal transduction histidine kinase